MVLYLALLHEGIAARSPGTQQQQSASLAGNTGSNPKSFNAVHQAPVDDNTAARLSLRKALLGRPVGPSPDAPGMATDEVQRVVALIEELREPIYNVAEVLERVDGARTTAEAKATFQQLTDRMRRLVEVLPDTLECTREAQTLEDSIQAEMRKVRARAEFEEAYIIRLLERQRQCKAMSTLLQGNVSEQYENMRKPVLELLRLLDAKEKHLKEEIMQVPHEYAL